MVNVEQYEYMTGPHDSVGLKVLLHDSSHVAMVRDLGEALPTGSHAFVAVTLSKVSCCLALSPHAQHSPGPLGQGS